MFICEVCKQYSVPGLRATRVVLERRVRTYDLGGGLTTAGWEIVREALAHSECALRVETGAREADEAARKAAQGGAMLGEVFKTAPDTEGMARGMLRTEKVDSVDDYLATGEVDDLAPGEVTVEFTPEPKLTAPIEVLAKPKKQRLKKVKN